MAGDYVLNSGVSILLWENREELTCPSAWYASTRATIMLNLSRQPGWPSPSRTETPSQARPGLCCDEGGSLQRPWHRHWPVGPAAHQVRSGHYLLDIGAGLVNCR